jgi:mRNA interferase HicA
VSLRSGHFCPILKERVKGSELIRKVEALGKQTGLAVRFLPARGKGSHGTLLYGDRFAIVPDVKKELKTGTQAAILKSLGINKL